MSEEFEKEINERANTVVNIAASNGEDAPMGKMAGILGAAKTPEAAQVLKMAIDQELAAQKAAMGISTEPEPEDSKLSFIQDGIAKAVELEEKVGLIADGVVTPDVVAEGVPESETTVSAPEEPMIVELPKTEQPDVVTSGYVEPVEEKKVVTIDDENSTMEPITETFDEYMERHKDDQGIDEIEVEEDSATKVIQERYEDMSFEDARVLANILKRWQNKQIGNLQAYNEFPQFMTIDFNAQLMKAGIPFKDQAAHKKEFAKSILEDLESSTQIRQATDEMNQKIEDTYNKYGADINILYQAGIYEKINNMKEAAQKLREEEYNIALAANSDMTEEEWKENRDRKADDLDAIVNSLYESFRLTEFAKRIGHIKAKQIDLTDPRRCFVHFASKYARSKFTCADVSTIVPILESKCDFTHEQAIEFAVVFCEYCRNMRPTNIAEHVFMYYTIANINSLSMNVQDKAAIFADSLKDNIKALWAIREAKGNGEDYVAKEMSAEDVAALLQRSEELVKQAEEEAKNEQEAEKVEEVPEEVAKVSEEVESDAEQSDELHNV